MKMKNNTYFFVFLTPNVFFDLSAILAHRKRTFVTNKRINILKDIKNHADIMKKCALKSYLCYHEKMRFKKLLDNTGSFLKLPVLS